MSSLSSLAHCPQRSKHLSLIYNKVGQQFCEISLYENTEELFGDFEENDYLCIRYLTY